MRPNPLFFKIALSSTAFFFVAQQVPFLAFLHWFPSNLPFYLTLTLLGGVVLWQNLNSSRGVPLLTRFKQLLLVFLPVFLIFGFGLLFSSAFHFTVFLSVGVYSFAWLLIWSSELLASYTLPTSSLHEFGSPLALTSKASQPFAGAIFCLTLLFFGFGAYQLTHFAAVDEPLWLDGRIGKFFRYLEEGKMDKTLVSDKPGITLVLASGPGLLFVEPKTYRHTRAEYTAKYPEADMHDFYLAFRLPLLIVITCLLPFFFLLLVPLIGRETALFSYAAITLAPITIGMSKIVNPDALLWVLAPLSLLSWIAFLEKRDRLFLTLSGIFFGLSLLTKYVANILIIFIIGLSILWPVLMYNAQTAIVRIREALTASLLWGSIGLTLLYLFIPAFWLDPELLIEATFLSQAFEKVTWVFSFLIILFLLDHFAWRGRSLTWSISQGIRWRQILGYLLLLGFSLPFLFVLLHTLLGMPWVNFMEILSSPKSSFQAIDTLPIFLTHFYPLVFGIPPIVLLGVLYLLFSVYRSLRSSLPLSLSGRLALALIFCIFLYYLGGSVNGVALIQRYQIILFPLITLLGTIGLLGILAHITLRLPVSQKALFIKSGFVGLIALLLLSPLTTPLPQSYASALLPERFTLDVKDMGNGSYEAALYLNQLPQASQLTIWTDKGGVCKFFVGTCLDGLTFEKLKQYRLDYVVVSSSRANRLERWFQNPYLLNDEGLIRFDRYYERTDPVYTFEINHRSGHTVKVFRFTE